MLHLDSCLHAKPQPSQQPQTDLEEAPSTSPLQQLPPGLHTLTHLLISSLAPSLPPPLIFSLAPPEAPLLPPPLPALVFPLTVACSPPRLSTRIKSDSEFIGMDSM